MDTDPEFDLKDFQARVFDDFTYLLNTHSFAKAYSGGHLSTGNLQEAADPKGSPGLFVKGLSAFLSRLGKQAEEKIINDPKLVAAENLATEIISRPEVKKHLCLAFKREISVDLFRTAALATDEVVSRFSIERDVRLFASIGLNTWRKGLWKYCALKPASKGTPDSAERKEFQREVFNAYRSFRNSTERAQRFAEKGYGRSNPSPAQVGEEDLLLPLSTRWRKRLTIGI